MNMLMRACWSGIGWAGTARLARWLSVLVAWTVLLVAGLALLQVISMPAPYAPAPPAGAAAGRLLLQSEPWGTPPDARATVAEPILDHRSHSDTDLLVDVQRRLPSLPVAYWDKIKNKHGQKFYKNKTCAAYPSIYELQFNNVYWQTLQSSNGTFHLFGAYYDVRELSVIGRSIRILSVYNRIEPTITTHCHIWYENEDQPVIVKTYEYKYIWYKKWGNYLQGVFQPYLMTCIIPGSHKNKVPLSVSVVEKQCDKATNNLRVIYEKPAVKKKFAVCVKGLDFLEEDLSVRLVEWIELLSLLGADKIFFYQLQVHPNITKVLDYYQKRDKVSVTPITLPGGQPNLPGFQHMFLKNKLNHKRQNELIPYNDCLYKNLYNYEYIALLDIDEVIMPVKDENWNALLKRIVVTQKDKEKASYNVRNVYFLDDLLHQHGWFKDIPKYMHMLQHVYRAKNFTKPMQYVKCFHNPMRVLTLHNHFPLACLNGGCGSFSVDTQDAQLQHYRADCVNTLKKSCNQFKQDSVMDTSIWRFKEPLIENSVRALQALGFFGPVSDGR